MCGQQKTIKPPLQQPAQPRYANYWAPLTHKRHLLQPAQPQHTNDGLCERGNNTSRSTGRSSQQNAATQHSMRRDEWVTVQCPVKKQQPNGMSHGGGGGGFTRGKFFGAHPHPLGRACAKKLSSHNCSIWNIFTLGQLLVQNWKCLHQISECIWITPLHMACNELFEPIDASILILTSERGSSAPPP